MAERLTTDHERYMRFVLENRGPAKDYERGISRDDIRLLMHEIDCLREDNTRLRAALQPFATFKDEAGFPGDDALSQDLLGGPALPDSHGYELVWADENDGGVVNFTAGQFRRAREAFKGGGS